MNCLHMIQQLLLLRQSWALKLILYRAKRPKRPVLGGGNSNIFHFHPDPGEMIQFIFQMGWFNHQLECVWNPSCAPDCAPEVCPESPRIKVTKISQRLNRKDHLPLPSFFRGDVC